MIAILDCILAYLMKFTRSDQLVLDLSLRMVSSVSIIGLIKKCLCYLESKGDMDLF